MVYDNNNFTLDSLHKFIDKLNKDRDNKYHRVDYIMTDQECREMDYEMIEHTCNYMNVLVSVTGRNTLIERQKQGK